MGNPAERTCCVSCSEWWVVRSSWRGPGGTVSDLATVGRTCARAALCLSQFLVQVMQRNGCYNQISGDVQLYPLFVVGVLVPMC